MTLLIQAARAVGRPVHAQTSQWWRRILLSRATDATGLVTGRRLMVLAPHPDDETFGCGALIARARAAGDQVVVVVVTDGRHSTTSTMLDPLVLAQVRTAELRQACAALGVGDEDVVQLNREDGTLNDCVPELAAQLTALIAERRPEAVFVTCAQDIHPDHQALHRALEVAMQTVSPHPAVFAYPVWTWMSGPWFVEAERDRRRHLLAWAMRQVSAPGWVAVRCDDYLAAKRSAVQAYASQTTNLTGESSWSFLPPDSVSLFLQPSEIFLPIATRQPAL